MEKTIEPRMASFEELSAVATLLTSTKNLIDQIRRRSAKSPASSMANGGPRAWRHPETVVMPPLLRGFQAMKKKGVGQSPYPVVMRTTWMRVIVSHTPGVVDEISKAQKRILKTSVPHHSPRIKLLRVSISLLRFHVIQFSPSESSV